MSTKVDQFIADLDGGVLCKKNLLKGKKYYG